MSKNHLMKFSLKSLLFLSCAAAFGMLMQYNPFNQPAYGQIAGGKDSDIIALTMDKNLIIVDSSNKKFLVYEIKGTTPSRLYEVRSFEQILQANSGFFKGIDSKKEEAALRKANR